MKHFSEKYLHAFFDAGIVIKLIESASEIILGFLVLFLNAGTARAIMTAIFGDEFNEASLQAIWNFALHSFSQISNNSQGFLAFIFLSHGLVKIILAAGLAKNKLWVYPLAAAAFTAFGLYQIYQIVVARSLILEILTVLDALFVALIIHEYRFQKTLTSGP